MLDHGVTAIVDLRNPGERPPAPPPRVASLHVPLDDVGDREFWDCWHDEPPPLYYRAFLERKPERCADAIRAIAEAGPGAVVFHCGGGRDRTGLVALLLLALAGVEHDEIVRDYELSYERMRRYYAARGEDDQRAEIQRLLTAAGTSARAVLLDLLADLDAERVVSDAGLTAAVRARLRPPGAGTGPRATRGSGRRSAW